MANTKYFDLYMYMRTFLNDVSGEFIQFSNDELDIFISTYIAIAGTPVKNGELQEFTSELTIQQQALLSAKTVIMVLENQDTYKFQTKIYSVGDRASNIKSRIQSLRDKIDEFEDGTTGGLAIASDGDWRAVFGIQTAENTLNVIDKDFSGGTGTP